MADFKDADLRGARFDRADLAGAEFRACDLSDAAFRGSALHRVTMRGVELCDVDITGELLRVTVNGVDIAPLVEAELNRRDPDRPRTPRRWRGRAGRRRSASLCRSACSSY